MENDVIKRSELIAQLCDLGSTWQDTLAFDGIMMSLVKVRQAPSAGVSITKCKDCKHASVPPNPRVPEGIIKCLCEDSPCVHRLCKPDDFCKYGERR